LSKWKPKGRKSFGSASPLAFAGVVELTQALRHFCRVCNAPVAAKQFDAEGIHRKTLLPLYLGDGVKQCAQTVNQRRGTLRLLGGFLFFGSAGFGLGRWITTSGMPSSMWETPKITPSYPRIYGDNYGHKCNTYRRKKARV